MPTPHEMYDVERKRKVKDLPLLKTLKSTIDAINVLTGKLQQAEAQENWEAYGHVQELITRLSSNHNSNATPHDFEATGNKAVGIHPTETINSDDDFEPTEIIAVRHSSS
jgi:hypothetical protein